MFVRACIEPIKELFHNVEDLNAECGLISLVSHVTLAATNGQFRETAIQKKGPPPLSKL